MLPLPVKTATLVAITAFMLMAASPASAGDISVKITSPRANATIGKQVNVQARVRPVRKNYKITYYFDGKPLAVQRGGASSSVGRSQKLNIANARRGRHTLRIVVQTGSKKKSSKSVIVNVVRPADSGTAKGSPKVETAGDQTTIPESASFPTGNAQDFKLIFADDFTKDAALGSMGSDSDPDKIVYTGASGTKWRTYPRTYKDTYQKRPYRSDQVLSVQNGNLDFWLRNVDGQPAGANPSPVLPNGSQYQTYGRYSARVKVDATDLSEYYMAWLLWPQNESDWASAESDYPEGSLRPGRNGVTAFSHYGPGQQEWAEDSSVDLHEWHTYTQDWTPLVRRYYVDGRLFKTTSSPVYSGPQRWQLQTETNGNGNGNGHLKVDWVAVYSYAPGTTPAS